MVRPADIAPTLPELMELPKPKDMTGHSLLRADWGPLCRGPDNPGSICDRGETR